MRLLFVKESLAWPRSSGHDVHCYHMMRALSELGHDLALATLAEPPAQAVAGLPLGMYRAIGDARGERNGQEPLALTKMQEKFRSYWGIPVDRIHAVGEMAREFQAEAVVVVGLNVLPYLGAVQNAQRIWYAADEWAWHHFSQWRVLQKRTWGNLRQALVKGLYERAYKSILDRVWVVSEADRRAMRWVAGVRAVDVLPNGVDSEHYRPLNVDQTPHSCVFWGRLDFGPNIQALEWFCAKVWPLIRSRVPSACFTIYGFQPGPEVRALLNQPGISVVPDLPDLREEISRAQVVVLPFVSGGGIKNKLLEAAGLGKAIVGTTRACGGLSLDGSPPLKLARSASQWVHAIVSLWNDAEERRRLGEAARAWVLREHSWIQTARKAVEALAAKGMAAALIE